MIRLNRDDRDQILNDIAFDLTPLLDVVFILIFFLVLSVNSATYSIDITLPEDKEGVASQITDIDVINVKILPNNIWHIGKKEYLDFDSFKQDFISIYSQGEKRVVVMSEKDVLVENFLELISFFKKQNIEMADILLDKKT